jgi:hypothetical protein
MGLTLLVSSVGAYDELIPEKGDENTAMYLAQLLYLYNRQVLSVTFHPWPTMYTYFYTTQQQYCNLSIRSYEISLHQIYYILQLIKDK